MATPITLTDRPPTYGAVLWDGTAEAAEWITATFGESAEITGEGDDLSLAMNSGTWPIDRGYYVVDRDGWFDIVEPTRINQYQPGLPDVEPA